MDGAGRGSKGGEAGWPGAEPRAAVPQACAQTLCTPKMLARESAEPQFPSQQMQQRRASKIATVEEQRNNLFAA